MADWIKFYSDFPSDQRFKLYSPKQKMALISLMLIANQCGGGIPPTIDDEDLAFDFEMSLSEWLALKNEWMSKGFILVNDNNAIEVVIWADRKDIGRPSFAEWAILRSEVFARDGYTCQYCGNSKARLECDHIMPVSRGGSNEKSNLITACKSCNQSKYNRTPEEWLGGAS